MSIELKCRAFELGKDYPELCEWWRVRKDWTFIPVHALPRNGFVVEGCNTKLAVVFLYICEANWGFMEWLTTNPKGPLKLRKPAIEAAVREAIEFAKSVGIRQVFSITPNENLVSIYEAAGFHRGQSGATEVVWRRAE